MVEVGAITRTSMMDLLVIVDSKYKYVDGTEQTIGMMLLHFYYGNSAFRFKINDFRGKFYIVQHRILQLIKPYLMRVAFGSQANPFRYSRHSRADRPSLATSQQKAKASLVSIRNLSMRYLKDF